MSHFVVMVIGEDPESQLAPYDENFEVEEYVIGDVSTEDKQMMLDHYNGCGHHFTSFEECYARFGNEWNGERFRKDANDQWKEYSTYNPKSRWDWYVLGGRWSGKFIRLKDGAQSCVYGEPGAGNNPVGVDAAIKGDIDFDAIRNEAEMQAREHYREIVKKLGGTIPKIELTWDEILYGSDYNDLTIEQKRDMYHSQESIKAWEAAGFGIPYYGPDLENYQCTEDEFVTRSGYDAFVPYAFVKDSQWYGLGDMGWWAISTNECPKEEWQKKVWDMINALPDNTLISFYDCHI